VQRGTHGDPGEASGSRIDVRGCDHGASVAERPAATIGLGEDLVEELAHRDPRTPVRRGLVLRAVLG
jgi:hypothetical protein